MTTVERSLGLGDMAEAPSETSTVSLLPEFKQLLLLLGFASDDPMTVCHRIPGASFTFERTTAADAPGVARKWIGNADVWFSTNVTHPGQPTGRGKAVDVVRCTALRADLDLKAANMDTLHEVVLEVSGILGQPPTAIVSSGNGIHPYWVLDAADDNWNTQVRDGFARCQLLFRRFHRLVAKIAQSHGVAVDNVSDLSRVLRVPGSVNRKMTCDGDPLGADAR